MVYVKPAQKIDYEKVIIDEFINGEIQEVQEFKDVEKDFMVDKEIEDEEGNITTQKVKETRKINQVRFKFKLEGYQYPHYTRKMTASVNEKSNLFKLLQMIYGEKLVPDIGVNLDLLKGLKVKVMYDEVKLKDGSMFQYACKVRALEEPPAIWDISEEEKTPF